MKIIWIDECGSTNSEISSYPAEEEPLILATRRQTAGRGQKGNVWESEPGKNLTFSAMWRPREFPARGQFALSEAVALAVADFLKGLGIDASVKWPNDIYAGNHKICGILIEHAVTGPFVTRTIAGVGINLNQKRFLSDAPNPVSCVMLTGREEEPEEALRQFAAALEARLAQTADEASRTALHEEFKRRMWRFDGAEHPFRDVARGEIYQGVIRDVLPTGMLLVEDPAGSIREYAFKEVEFLLKNH